jgi:molybdopterin biosynthesis enzyme
MPEKFAFPQRIRRLTPLADVLARIHASVNSVAERAAALEDALGCVLAADIIVGEPLPRVTLALRDGWAVQSALTSDASSYAPAPTPSAVRIDTGEPLPPEADAVAAIDGVIVHAGHVQAVAPVNPGEGVLPAGADLARGAALLHAGRKVSATHIALLKSTGVRNVRLRAPRVLLARARVRADPTMDAALQCIAHAVACAGATAVRCDANADLKEILQAADTDAAVIIGGTGCGEDDQAVASLAAVGDVAVHGIALIPGETAAFGTVRGRPALLLPGRLDAVLAVWHMLGRPLLARLSASNETLYVRHATLTRKVTSAAGLTELIPVACKEGLATPLAAAYLPLAALAQANGWLLIPPESEGFQAQSEVVIRPWP